MSLVGAEQYMVDAWVESKLTTTPVSTALNTISTGLSSRVFGYYAPPGTAYPFIIYQAQTPPSMLRGVGGSEILVTTLYVVKAVAAQSSFSNLATIANAIHTALHVPAGAVPTGGIVVASVYEEQFSLVEVENNEQYRHFGGVFRIQAKAA